MNSGSLTSAEPTFQSRKDSICQSKKSFRTSPDPESGQALSDLATFTKSYTPDFHSGEMVDRSTLRVETRGSPRMVSSGRSPRKKWGQQFFSRDTRVLFGNFSVLGELFYWYGSCGVLLIALRESDF